MDLILDQANLNLVRNGNVLEVREKGQLRERIPPKYLRSVILLNKVSVCSAALRLLAQHKITTVVLPARGNEPAYYLVPGFHRHATVRVIQHHIVADPCKRRLMAIQLLQKKLSSYQRAANWLAAESDVIAFPEVYRQLQQAKHTIEEERATLDLSTLMGHEGAAAAKWFAAYRSLFDDSWVFDKRNKRPPQDPINALLSLSYTLAQQPIRQALAGNGFDHYFGFLHQAQSGREALLLDMLELQRAAVDWWVARWIKEEQFCATTDFSISELEGCRLTKAGRGKYFALWHEAMMQWPAFCLEKEESRTATLQAVARWSAVWLRGELEKLYDGDET